MVIKLQNTKRKKEYILKVTRKKENKQTIIITKENSNNDHCQRIRKMQIKMRYNLHTLHWEN